METIPIGRPHTLTQNQAYATPGRKVTIHVQGSGMEQSEDNSTWVAVTPDDDENFDCVAPFIRSTAVATIVTAK